MSRVGEDSMRALFISAALTLLAVAPATAQIAMTGDFKAAKACPALQSIRKGTNPGDVMLEPGHSYSLIGKNKPDATHYLVAIDGAEPRERWVEVGCGETAEQPTPNPSAGATPTSPTRADFCDFRRAFRQQAIVSNDPDRLESAVVPTKPLARRKTRRESGSCFYATRFAAKTARCIGPGRSSRTGAPRVGA